MANDYKPGAYFERFLSQLPQIYQAQQNVRLQEERLDFMREQGRSDDEYRSQTLSATQESNRLADFKLQAESLVPGTKQYNTWLLSQPWVKKDPTVEKQIRETFEIEDDLMDRLRSTVAMNPLDGLEEVRKISLNTNLNKEHWQLLQTLRKQFREEAQVTQAEMQVQPSYANLENERLRLQKLREAGRQTNPVTGVTESIEDFKGRIDDAMLNIESYRKDVMEEERSARGKYPGLSVPFYEKYDFDVPMYDNIEDIPEKEIDEVLGNLGSETVESSVLPPEFTPPVRPSTPLQMDEPEVQRDVDAIPLEESELAFSSARDYSPISLEDMRKYGSQVFFDKDTNRWYDFQGNPATLSQIKTAQGKAKAQPKKLSANQQNNINRIVKQMAQLKTRSFSKQELERKINRLKKRILQIDPNYKFKD